MDWKGIDDLLRRPIRRRMVGDVEVNDPPAVVENHDEDEQDSTVDRWNSEDIDRAEGGDVIRLAMSATAGDAAAAQARRASTVVIAIVGGVTT